MEEFRVISENKIQECIEESNPQNNPTHIFFSTINSNDLKSRQGVGWNLSVRQRSLSLSLSLSLSVACGDATEMSFIIGLLEYMWNSSSLGIYNTTQSLCNAIRRPENRVIKRIGNFNVKNTFKLIKSAEWFHNFRNRWRGMFSLILFVF